MTIFRYQLPSEVFACLSGESLVFLDLNKDQYLCLDRATTAVLLNSVECFGASIKQRQSRKTPKDNEVTRNAVDVLIARGLLQLIDETEQGRKPIHVQASKPLLNVTTNADRPVARLSHWAKFFRASLAASAKLRCYPIHLTVQKFRLKKLHSVSLIQSCEGLIDLVSIFHRLRPFYPRKYLCLYDSLALLEFLSLFSLYPQWVFGVRTEPFNAHCWVQDNDQVLNDSVEEVRDYTPIMIV